MKYFELSARRGPLEQSDDAFPSFEQPWRYIETLNKTTSNYNSQSKCYIYIYI